MWYFAYIWVLAGKWRKWCIPGALLSMILCWLSPATKFFKDSPQILEIIRLVFVFLITPIKFIFELDFSDYPIIGFSIILVWFALLGAVGGAIAKLLWMLIRWRPWRFESYCQDNEIIEQVQESEYGS